MNNFSFDAVNQHVSMPKNMGEALALVRAGKLQEASEILLGGQTAIVPTQVAPARSKPFSAPGAGFTDHAAIGVARAGGAIDIADVLARSGMNLAGKPASPSKGPITPTADAPGQFQRVAFRHQVQDHPYWVYVPKTETATAGRPLVLMLHGCTQNAEDFARGTRMNATAEAEGALVLYPSQLQSANANGCWNWFRPQDQQAGSGEPALLLAMVQNAMAAHDIDHKRVYVAGLSAGGAMAAVLGQQYPEVFSAVGVHSGLAPGAAHNMMGALSAMKSGAKGWSSTSGSSARQVPLIVFHGDADSTVHPRNGEQLLEGAAAGLATSVQSRDIGTTPDGQRYTRTSVQNTAAEKPSALAEHWLLHGGGHAWSGGDAQGSHTTAKGVNASAEMLRFFLEHPR